MSITLPPLPEDALTRQKLGEYWLHNARMEHASIGAFARLSLELLSLGAPPDLLRQSASAQKDEIHHAEICFSLASHYLGEDISPWAYPGIISWGLRRVSLAELARESFVDGAIGEGIACHMAEKQSVLAKDEKLSTIYATIAEDEGKHAKLGWDIVEWALRTENEKEKRKINKTLHDALAKVQMSYRLKRLSSEEKTFFDSSLSNYGLMGETEYMNIRKEVYEESLRRLGKIIGKCGGGGSWWKMF